MTTTLDTRNLSLEDVYHLLKIERQLNNSFSSLLSLKSLTEVEQQKLEEIRNNFDNYYSWGKISEGQVNCLTIAPLMWLAGFYHSTVKITLEENIADILI